MHEVWQRTGRWKTAELAGEEMVAQAQGDDLAVAHYQLGVVLMSEALSRRKDDLYSRVHDEMTKALAAHDNFPNAIYLDGRALARMKQDDAAKAQFERFVKMRPEETPDRQRACAISASRSWRGPEWRRHSW
jgi:hypothetical protein